MPVDPALALVRVSETAPDLEASTEWEAPPLLLSAEAELEVSSVAPLVTEVRRGLVVPSLEGVI